MAGVISNLPSWVSKTLAENTNDATISTLYNPKDQTNEPQNSAGQKAEHLCNHRRYYL